jgi:hypothetical protein
MRKDKYLGMNNHKKHTNRQNTLRMLCVFLCGVVLAACGTNTVPTNTPPAGESPADIAARNCAAMGVNQICYGYGTVSATTARDGVQFSAPGNTVNIADLASVTTSAFNAGTGDYGIVMIRAAMDLPADQATSGQNAVTFIVYGGTTLESFNETMTEFTFRTDGEAPNEAAQSEAVFPGMLIQVPDGEQVNFTANGAQILLGSTALFEARPNQALIVAVLQGRAEVESAGQRRPVQSGTEVEVPLNELKADKPPSDPRAIPRERVVRAPTQGLVEPIQPNEVETQVAVAGQTLTAAVPLLTQAAANATPASGGRSEQVGEATATITATVTATVTPTSTPSESAQVAPIEATNTPQTVAQATAVVAERVTWTPNPTSPPLTNVAPDSIVYASRVSGVWDIFVAKSDGSDVQRLTNTPATDRNPRWSPDGSQVMFTTFAEQSTELAVVSVQGGALTQLTTLGNASNGDWSPDSTRIVYEQLVGTNREVFIINADGTNPVQLTDNPANDSEPVWSPDGSRIAFISDREGSRDLYTMNADGSDVQRVYVSSTDEASPAWSPDGSQIAFATERSGNTEIYIIPAAGGDAVRLTSNAATDRMPAWSPDGSQIVFVSDREGLPALYVSPIDGSDSRRVTALNADSDTPDWAR